MYRIVTAQLMRPGEQVGGLNDRPVDIEPEQRRLFSTEQLHRGGPGAMVDCTRPDRLADGGGELGAADQRRACEFRGSKQRFHIGRAGLEDVSLHPALASR